MAASLVGPIAGAAIGGLTSGGSDQTVTNKPYVKKNFDEAYDLLLEDALDLYKKPRTDLPTQRVSGPSDPYGSLFVNPQMLELQTRSDKEYFDNLPIAGETTAEDMADPAADAEARAMGREFYLGGMGMGDRFQKRHTEYDSVGMIPDDAYGQLGRAVLQTRKAGYDPNSQAGRDYMRQNDLEGAIQNILQQALMSGTERKVMM